MKINYHQTPGVVFDWISMLILKLNAREKWLSSVAAIGQEEEDMNYIMYWMGRFEQPDEVLRLFFYQSDQTSSCLFMQLFEQAMAEGGGEQVLTRLWEKLENPMELKKATVGYYLKQPVKGMSLGEIGALIREKRLPEEVRFLLLEFMISTENFRRVLWDTCHAYHQQMEQAHEVYQKEIEKCQSWVNQEEIQNCLAYFEPKKRKSVMEKLKEADQVSCSVAAIMKNTLLVNPTAPEGWVIIGQDVQQLLQARKNRKLSLAVIGNAVGDPTRAEIAQRVLNKKLKSCAEIAKELGMSANAANYHLEIMKRARVLNTYYIGRTAYYGINAEICKEAAAMFEKLAKYQYTALE